MITQVIVFFIILLLTYEFSKHFYRRKRLPQGPFRWPIIGNMIELAMADKYPHIAMAKMAEKYGDIFSFGFGVHEAVVISSYEAMKSIMTKEETLGRYAFPYVLDRAFHERLGLAFADGSGTIWRDLRRFSAKGLRDFGFGIRKPMEAVLSEETDALVAIIKTRSESENGIFASDPFVYAGSAVNILWQFVAGFRFPHGDDTFDKLLEYSETSSKMMAHANFYNPLPFLRYLFPTWTNFPEHQRNHKQAQDLMKDIIDTIRNKRADRGDEFFKPENFIEAFIDEIEKHKGDNENKIFTEKQLMIVLMDLFLGGSDTTGVMMNWMILFLTLNPKVQRKIQKELILNVGINGPISVSLVDRLPYTKATLQEIFRMAPMAPIPPPRESVKDFYYKNYLIPKGSVLMTNLYPGLNDKDFWGDPEVFRPERFLDESGTKQVLKFTERVAIFGFGKRMCFGETLARDTLFLALAKLMQAFTFESIPGEEPSAENPITAMTQSPRPYKIKIILN